MAPLQILSNRRERRERLIPTQIWDANYVHAMHYYQPMIDYLDAKRRGRTPERIPYLPYTEERGLNRFHTSHFAFRPYTAEEIALLSAEAVDKAESYLPDYRFNIKRSVLSLTATADAARLRKHVTPDSVLDRYQRKLSQRYAQQNQQESRNRMALCRRTQYYSEMKSDDLSPEVKKAIRGKSANQISNILLNESLNKSRASEERSMSKVVRSSSSARAISGSNRATSEVRTYVIKSSSTAEANSEETSQQYRAVHTSVDNVRREIKNFAVKTQEFLHDTR